MRWKLSVAALIVIAGVLAFFLLRENPFTRALPDGSKLVLSSVHVGRTNVHTRGTIVSKTIGRFAPTNSLSLAGYKLQRPVKLTLRGFEECEVLTAQFQLFPASARGDDFLKPPFYRKFRLLTTGEDGFSYVHEFFGPYVFKQYPDGIFAYLHTHTFPRTSCTLQIRLEERESADERNFREVATFTVKNPKRSTVQKWTVQESPHIRLAEDVEVEIGELVVRAEPIHSTDIWDYIAELPLRFTQRGQVLTNWSFHQAKVWDAIGNFDWFSANKRVTNGWSYFRSHRSLDPSVPWRFEVNFALVSDFPATNLFSFTIPWPVTGTNQTNFAGLPVSISYVNRDMLALELLTKPQDLRLTFVSARDDEGKDLDNFSGSWSQHRFWKSLSVGNNKGMNVHATVAIHRNYPATFTLQPRYDKPSTLP